MTLYSKLSSIKKEAVKDRSFNYYAFRTANQLAFAVNLSTARNHMYDEQISEAADFVVEELRKNGAITKSTATEFENLLMFMSPEAKKLKAICVSHAHIDMNWQWGYQETAATVIDTFRTVLELMKEYPTLTFSQSQGSVYKIAEENCPEILAEIKKRVHEGRWEISASTWVEPDKNMPNGESLARHILYTKRYLSKLFDISADSMLLDFEPDTFGHNWSVPEILNKGGVKYYYQCRGYDGDSLYRWQSRSGAEVIAYNEKKWYCGYAEYDMFVDVPLFCDINSVDAQLIVYGVGNHGGGPTRRDIERISDMAGWPLMPSITFGTYNQYFKHIEKFYNNLPVINQELNFVFTGCYTSQSRIKMANRISEDKLYEAEAFSAAALLFNKRNDAARFKKAWENVLFNQFHDILPGSGVIDTREHAMGLFQDTLTIANTCAQNALLTIAGRIDTSGIEIDRSPDDYSEGAGVGFPTAYGSGYGFPQTERGAGKTRIYHIFNPTEFDREGPCELSVWDWKYDASRISVKGTDGAAVAWKRTQESTHYWGHDYFKITIYAKVPALGYATYILTEEAGHQPPVMAIWGESRCNDITDDDLVLENSKVKAVFDRRTMCLRSFIQKESGVDMVDSPSAYFRHIKEGYLGGSSWNVGEYEQIENLNEAHGVHVYGKSLEGIRKWVAYEIEFKNSKLNVTVTLDDNSSMLKFSITADWHEVGNRNKGIPQLNFFVPLGIAASKYRYDIPFATIDRDAANFDMPGNSYAAALPEDGGAAAMVVTDSRYGFRTAQNSIAVNLIRSSDDPDPYPEYGIHHMNIGVCIPDNLDNRTFAKIRHELVHPLPVISGRKHAGDFPLTGKLFELSGDVLLSAIKTGEDCQNGKTMILRLYDANGKGARAKLDFKLNIEAAYIADINETWQKDIPVNENGFCVDVPPYEVVTVAVKFGKGNE